MMRVVFLDIDGVLNSTAWFKSLAGISGLSRAQGHLDPAAIALLNGLLNRTGAVVVISSTWRYFGLEACVEMLRERGFTGTVVGVTPRLALSHARGLEIQQWLDDATEHVERFVILDDDSDMAHLMPRLVHTDHGIGLTPSDVSRAAMMLEADEPAAVLVN